MNYILPFEDVAESSYYAEAVRWAASQGIVSGVSPTRFGPDLPCTRAQAMTFLYGAMGSPAVTGGSGFLDVDSGAYYAGPVAWAVKNHIPPAPETACSAQRTSVPAPRSSRSCLGCMRSK